MLENVEHLFAELLKAIEIRKLDYKRDQYRLDTDHNKSLFIKDILCIANAPGGDGYILLGVKSEKGKPREVIGISKHYDSSDLEQLVNSKVLEPIHFDYYRLKYEGLDCVLLHIPPSRGRPHWPQKDFGMLRGHVFYTRRALGNRVASIPEIREMFLQTTPISDIALQKARATGHIIDELVDMSVNDREIAMYKIFRSIAPKIHLTNYHSLTSTYITGQAGALVTDTTKKSVDDYCIVMYPWIAKRDNIIWTRQTIVSLIEGSRSTKLRASTRIRLKGSTLAHISYKNIYTRALQSRYYSDSLHHYYRFANEWVEQWGRIIKWEDRIPEVHERKVHQKKQFLTSYQKIAKYEFFLPNVSSKDELEDRMEKLLFWVSNNPV